ATDEVMNPGAPQQLLESLPFETAPPPSAGEQPAAQLEREPAPAFRVEDDLPELRVAGATRGPGVLAQEDVNDRPEARDVRAKQEATRAPVQELEQLHGALSPHLTRVGKACNRG